MKRSKPRSLTGQLVDAIRQDILNGIYPPDSQLRQETLAEQYGVSRIPVREALLQLENEGLVSITPHRGTTVTPLSLIEIDDVFSLRELLEIRLYRASAPQLSESALDNAFGINERYREAIARNERAQLGILNAELHLALYGEAQQPRTQQIVAALLQTSERYTRIQLNSKAALQQSLTEHDALLAMTRARDFAQGEALLLQHLQQVRYALERVLRQEMPVHSADQ